MSTTWNRRLRRGFCVPARLLGIATVTGAVLDVARADPPCQALPPPKYSFDFASPTVGDGDVAANAILAVTPGGMLPTEFIPGANLGLSPSDDLDALSPAYPGVSPAASFVILFSVDRNTVGSVPPDPEAIALGAPYNVSHQTERHQAAGDQYLGLELATRMGVLPRLGRARGGNNNVLTRNNWNEGGTDFNAKPPTPVDVFNSLHRVIEPQDNVDAMGNFQGDNPGAIGPVFYSIRKPQMPRDPRSGADIFVDLDPSASGGEQLFLRGEDIGLMTQDDIDGLIVFDDGVVGVPDNGDQVVFTLRPGSPTLIAMGLGPADILSFTFTPGAPEPIMLFAAALMLGVADPQDSIDALDLAFCENGLGCAGQNGIRATACPAVSEWGFLVFAVLLVTVGSLICRHLKVATLRYCRLQP